MRFSDRVILSLHWRLTQARASTLILRAARRLLSLMMPYTPVPTLFPEGTRFSDVAVEVRQSTVPAAGRGLFAVSPVKEGERIGEYLGDTVSSAWQWLRLRNKDYVMMTQDPTVFIDSANRPEVLMRYLNHHFDSDKINVRRVAQGTRVYFYAARDIDPGEELFISYGDLYWQLRGYSDTASAKAKPARR